VREVDCFEGWKRLVESWNWWLAISWKLGASLGQFFGSIFEIQQEQFAQKMIG